VSVSLGAKRGHETKERRRASAAFDRRKRGNGGGGDPARVSAGARGRRLSNMCEARVERGAGQGGPRLGCCHGLAQAHSADFDLKRISKLNTI
jgi:hypothetical protein